MSTRPSKDQKAQWKAERTERDRKAKAAYDKKMAQIREDNKGKGGDSGQAGALGSIFSW